MLVKLGADLLRTRQQLMQTLAEYAPGAHPGASPAPASEPPHCPRCRASLTTAAAYKVVHASGQEEAEQPLRFVVLYCRNCGTALGTAP